MSDHFIIPWTAINRPGPFAHMQPLSSAALHKLNPRSSSALHSTSLAAPPPTIIDVATAELEQELLKTTDPVDATSESLAEMAGPTKCKGSPMIAITSKKLKIDGHTASHAQVSQTTSSAGIARYELGGPVDLLPGDNSRPSESVYRRWPAIMFKWD